MAVKTKALKQFNNGNISQAQSLYEKYIKSNPADPEAYYMLGVIYGQEGNAAISEKHFRKSISLYPSSAMSYCGLGSALLAQNRFEDAASAFQSAYKINPQLLDAYYNFACMLFRLKKYDSARDACFDILKKDPGYAKANLLIGNIKLELREDIEAMQYYLAAIRSDPAFGEAHYHLGNLYFRSGYIEESIDSFRQSIKYRTPNFDPYIALGRVQFTYGYIEDARSSYELALKENPGKIDAIAGMASIHEYLGDTDKAHDLLYPFIKNKSQFSINVIGIYAKMCSHYGTCQELIDYIDTVENSGIDIDWNSRCILNYAKGTIHDKQKNYDDAFMEYQKANRLVPDTYERMKYEIRLNELRNTYTPNFVIGRPKSSFVEKALIFIVGMPRSGTSLTEQVLASHSEVYGAGELIFMQNITKNICTRHGSHYPLCIPGLDQSDLNFHASEYYKKLASVNKDDANFVIDKMPHNYLHLGLISQLFPDSKIIHCIRNPIDTCLSIYFQNFNDTHTYANDLSNLAHHYYTYSELMKYWKSILPLDIHEVVYEEFIDDFENKSRDLVRFCGLRWEDQCAEFYRTKRHVSTASQNQVNKPIYNTSVARWKRYENHIGELLEGLRNYGIIEVS